MSRKGKLEKDYKDFNLKIELEAENQLKKIQEESDALRKEARKIGEAVERSINKKRPKAPEKKVNT